MDVAKDVRLRLWALGVLAAASVGCSGLPETSTARQQQALGATTDFIWSCPQPTDPEFDGNAGDFCLAAYGGDTTFCSGLCCPPGSTMTYDGDGGGFKAGPAYCRYPDTCGGYGDAHPEYTNGCVDYVDGQSPRCQGTVVGVDSSSGYFRCCCTYKPTCDVPRPTCEEVGGFRHESGNCAIPYDPASPPDFTELCSNCGCWGGDCWNWGDEGLQFCSAL